ncbi:DNA methyltransferase 1-associated protein 1 isoform X1 [Tribolium castaneum]|uniref:DNA methyltransferase 1-associated protein 1 n=1 Tax=Tribolium castaneum TaxID=7070 RepID=D6WR58_TRICA|nr:PREDICTED: DNA methyltransferase 1-associated protein 1 isoform X1 [Tribolium castaneum]EFA07023.2 DNA methyltransferase 1-associated protein 1-like Protein [Tribolium castaneum]|eukprot:XP_008195930.1 PREDICTED: DNA methyltransferase 1-associated protein 1 isoform X1 [Tribolium castaneum]
MADVRDIMELEHPASQEVTRESIIGSDKQRKRPPTTTKTQKRPEGMHREVFALLYNDNKDVSPLFPSDTGHGYKQTKIKLGMRKPRKWKWVPFTNPARTDGAVFHHWRRPSDEPKEYPFAKFNKKVDICTYTDAEYQQHLRVDGWTKDETDHMMQLAQRFDLRFILMADRYDTEKFPKRSVEDIKDRYYKICGIMSKLRGEKKIYTYDVDHEKRRKEQLKKLYDRTQEQIEEEQFLLLELKKIEARKKERERKTQDLQKLISQADSQSETPRKTDKKLPKKKIANPSRPSRVDTAHILQAVETAGIKFPDYKNSGVSLRSQRMKLPANVGQKKSKGIEQMLQEIGLELNPIPTEEICQNFNELRSDMVLLMEIKSALSTCEFELQSLRHQYEALNPGKTLTIPPQLISNLDLENKAGTGEIIDVVGSPSTPTS